MSFGSCWLWRCHTFVDGSGQSLQGIAEGCRFYKRIQYLHGHCYTCLGNVIPLSRRSIELFNSAVIDPGGRPTLRPCHGTSTGGAGMDRDYEGGALKKLQGLWRWDWAGSKRSMGGEARRRRDDDEGDWKHSPEWWGRQGRGWGRNDGEIVFEMPTAMGNGVVSVTAHPVSIPLQRKGVNTDLKTQQRTTGAQSPNKHPPQDSGKDRKNSLVGDRYQVLGYEWRVLRFNTITRQSVAKVMAVRKNEDPDDVILLQQPNCLAFEYVKSLISAGLAAVSLSGLDLGLVANGLQKMQVLCIGLGGGSLPLFLAHNFAGATVDVVELDANVITAAVEKMGFPPCLVVDSNGKAIRFPWARQGKNSAFRETMDSSRDSETSGKIHTPLSAERQQSWASTPGEPDKDPPTMWKDMVQRLVIHENDGEDFICAEAQKFIAQRPQYDLVFVDAYDGEDVVPFKFWDRNGPFLSALSDLLNPDHGTVVVNLHTDSDPPSFLEKLSGNYGPGFDPTRPQGKRVEEAAIAYRSFERSPNLSKTNIVYFKMSRPYSFPAQVLFQILKMLDVVLCPFRDVLLRARDFWSLQEGRVDPAVTHVRGLAFTVAVSLQGNISLVVTRGASPAQETMLNTIDHRIGRRNVILDDLMDEAEGVQKILNVPFDMAPRLSRGFRTL